MQLTKSTISLQLYREPTHLIPSYSFDYEGVELHVFKWCRSWSVGEPITGLVIGLYVTCTTRKQALEETLKQIERSGGVERIHRAIKSNPRPS